MSIQRNHENAIAITPPTLKQQIIIRLNTLIKKEGGEYYFHKVDMKSTNSVIEIEGMKIHGLKTKDRDLYVIAVSTNEDVINNTDEKYITYNAKEFYIEQLWEIYIACNPIYQSKFNDYATTQD
jgi:hypothetical protein